MMTDIILPDGFDRGEVLFPEETQKSVDTAAIPEQNEPDPIEIQNAEAAAKAPVRGVSGNIYADTDEKSLFEQGFDAASRW